jgi:hypothetical protein
MARLRSGGGGRCERWESTEMAGEMGREERGREEGGEDLQSANGLGALGCAGNSASVLRHQPKRGHVPGRNRRKTE